MEASLRTADITMLFLIGMVFFIVGVLFLTLPNYVRRIDRKMSWLIKDPAMYRFVIKVAGVFFIASSILAFVGVCKLAFTQ